MAEQPFVFTHGASSGSVDTNNFVEYEGLRFHLSHAAGILRKTIEATRQEILGFPRTMRIYDNPRYIDRYTVVFMDEPQGDGLYSALSMNHEPLHPLGFGQHTQAIVGYHLGRRIWLTDLPEQCRRFICIDRSLDITYERQGLL